MGEKSFLDYKEGLTPMKKGGLGSKDSDCYASSSDRTPPLKPADHKGKTSHQHLLLSETGLYPKLE